MKKYKEAYPKDIVTVAIDFAHSSIPVDLEQEKQEKQEMEETEETEEMKDLYNKVMSGEIEIENSGSCDCHDFYVTSNEKESGIYVVEGAFFCEDDCDQVTIIQGEKILIEMGYDSIDVYFLQNNTFKNALVGGAKAQEILKRISATMPAPKHSIAKRTGAIEKFLRENSFKVIKEGEQIILKKTETLDTTAKDTNTLLEFYEQQTVIS